MTYNLQPQWTKANKVLTKPRNQKGFKLTHSKKARLDLMAWNNLFSFDRSTLTKRLANQSNKITSDQYRRTAYLRGELERKVLKGLLSYGEPTYSNQQPKHSNKLSAVNGVKFSQLAYHSAVSRKLSVKINSITRIRNRCVLTAHPSIVGNLGISRIVFRSLAGFGQLPGVKKI